MIYDRVLIYSCSFVWHRMVWNTYTSDCCSCLSTMNHIHMHCEYDFNKRICCRIKGCGTNDCVYANDGECDEPTYCNGTTDSTDCGIIMCDQVWWNLILTTCVWMHCTTTNMFANFFAHCLRHVCIYAYSSCVCAHVYLRFRYIT